MSYIKTALKEDIGKGDVTTDLLFNTRDAKHCVSTFYLIVNENAVISGLEIFKKTFKTLDKNIIIKSKYKDGDNVKKGRVVASLRGKVSSILKAERTALNFICHLSGIATTTRKLISLVSKTNVVLLDTRKTTPNLRLLEKQAVRHGGGTNHRFNLSDMILIKGNHLDKSTKVNELIQKAKKRLHALKIEVEVRNLSELKKIIDAKPDIIMFDNWSPKNLKKAIKLIPKNIQTEASGQITPQNILAYAKTGVKRISTSYMVKNSRWIDFALRVIINSIH